MPSISVTIIARNESHVIRDCLRSVSFADEIIVLDSGSTDGTPDICRQFTPHVFETDWPGFGVQKNRALDKASCDWILSLDADESISDELAGQIREAICSDKWDAYRLRFEVKFLGRILRHGDWARTRKVRLVRRHCGKFTETDLHEELVVSGQVGELSGVAVHSPVESLEDFVSKMNHYSSTGAHQRRKRGETSSVIKAVSHGLWSFFRSYFLRCGFLDGREGFLQAAGSGLGRFFRYAKLMYPDTRGK